MNIKNFIRDEDFPDYWVYDSINLCDRFSDVCITINDGSKEISNEYISTIEKICSTLSILIDKASTLILDIYSFDNINSIDDLSKAIVIQTILFEDPKGLTYEVGFSLEWDEDHSYDVEFENHEAISLSVNG